MSFEPTSATVLQQTRRVEQFIVQRLYKSHGLINGTAPILLLNCVISTQMLQLHATAHASNVMAHSSCGAKY
jgi:hypothetical protein